MRKVRQPRPALQVWIALAATCCALAIAACGGSSNGSANDSPSAGKADQGIRFADCMRSHGLPNFPDPSGGGGGIKIPIGSGINPQSPAFKHAQSACRHLLPGGGPPSGHSAQAHAQLLALSECMRAHGVSDFPDPTASPPANINDYSFAFGRGGYFIAVPKTIDPSSPVFMQAANACRFPGARGHKAVL